MSAELQSTHFLGDIMKYRQTSPTASEATTLPCGSEAAYQDSDFDTDSDCPESPLNQTKLPPTATQGALDLVRKESRLLVGLIKDNLNAGATPVVVMYVATACATTGATWRGTLAAAAMGLLYLTVFDLVNQWSGVTEDVINKPWRPIPKGLMTAAGLVFGMAFPLACGFLVCRNNMCSQLCSLAELRFGAARCAVELWQSHVWPYHTRTA